MADDRNSTQAEAGRAQGSVARRREILRRMGQASIAAGAVASPMAAMATGSRKWCKHKTDPNKCVQASVSGAGSIVLSRQANDEVKCKNPTHYSDCSKWPATCTAGNGSGGYVTVKCNDPNDANNVKLRVAFNCLGLTQDSRGYPLADSRCLLNMGPAKVCATAPDSLEAHWATALGNANKLATPLEGAPFPYTPREVIELALSANSSTALAFFRDYCEAYSA